MTLGNNGPSNNLDFIRHSHGIDFCRNMFFNLGKAHRQNAVQLVNDSSLFFTSLFVLLPQIHELNLTEELSERNRIALNICEIICNEKYSNGDYNYLISLKSEKVHRVLLWVFNTGAADDGINDEFEQILDSAASVLIKTHHEKAIIPIMIAMIFNRNRKGGYIHDLVWACFQTRDTSTLRYLAERLRSPVAKDVELARTLLNLPQNLPLRSTLEKQKEYTTYLSWLNENNPYIRFTGESFNFTSIPVPCIVDLEAKYLCKEGYVQDSKQLDSIADSEHSYLSDFNKLPENDKSILAKYSQHLHNQNQSYWNEWIHYSVDKQIQSARNGGREFV